MIPLKVPEVAKELRARRSCEHAKGVVGEAKRRQIARQVPVELIAVLKDSRESAGTIVGKTLPDLSRKSPALDVKFSNLHQDAVRRVGIGDAGDDSPHPSIALGETCPKVGTVDPHDGNTE